MRTNPHIEVVMLFHANESLAVCAACGNAFFVLNIEEGKPAVIRYPLECPECGAKQVYAAETPEKE